MSDIAAVWDRLRKVGLQDLAPLLVAHGVKSTRDIVGKVDQLRTAGVSTWQLEMLTQGVCVALPDKTPAGRADIPSMPSGGRASSELAFAAAHTSNRKRALADLENSFLAASTQPAVGSRVQLYESLCNAWEVTPWPVTYQSMKCFAASLKAGRYRSASLYFQAVLGHQQRALEMPVEDFLKQSVKHFTRAVTRGLGPSHLKDSLDIQSLARVTPQQEPTPFDTENVSHGRDVCILASWFMMRELELAAAQKAHVYFSGTAVNLLLPVHKTDASGSLTLRTLQCSCKVKTHPLCPFHAAKRHLARLELHGGFRQQVLFPLVPNREGRTLSKAAMIAFFTRTIAATGTPIERPNEHNIMIPRFGGHVLRVSGAQFLARAHVAVSLIQLLGRWSSGAIERYLQSAPLVHVPHISSTVLVCGSGSIGGKVSGESTSTLASTAAQPSQEPMICERDVPRADFQSLSDLKSQVDDLQSQLSALQSSVISPEVVLVHRRRSQIVHQGETDEKANIPAHWKTRCGWMYGLSSFYRLHQVGQRYRRCRKCFRLESQPDAPASGDEEDGSESDASSSSSE